MASVYKVGPIRESVANDSYRELINRIVTSASFSKAERLTSLLMYICNTTLDGRAEELNEHNIGEAVFGRSRDYDSANDGIVRVQVSRLRQRLDLYFEGEGAEEPVRVVIPRGAYIPYFEPRPAKDEPVLIAQLQPVEGPVATTDESSRGESSAARSRRVLILILACGLAGVLAMALLALLWRNTGIRKKSQPAPPVHALWSEMFTPFRRTTIVLADSNLVVWQGLMKRDIHLSEYLSGDYRTNLPTNATPLQKDILAVARGRYTSMIDVEMIQYFSRLAEIRGNRFDVRYARDLRPNDLKVGNIILSGSPEANPWVQLFEQDMNFVFSYDRALGKSAVVNRAPQGNEPREWDANSTDQQHHVFGVVAYLPNLSGNGDVLILEGTTIAGTESALDFVSDDSQLLPFLNQIRRADGKLPHFEVVLGTASMSGSAVKNSILAWRRKD
jgi:hypothetical protein